MATQTVTKRETKTGITLTGWLKIGLKTALFSVMTVLIVQALAVAIWPEIRTFKPLDSYPRSALFTLIPALGATAVFAWLVRHQSQPDKKFIILSGSTGAAVFSPLKGVFVFAQNVSHMGS